MENRTQLEVRKLFLTFLSKVSKRNKNILLKTLETIVAEYRRNKNSKPNNNTDKKVNDDEVSAQYIKDLFDSFSKQLDHREYVKLVSIIEFEIMKPSNIYGYLRESTPESDDDDDIQIIEVVQSNATIIKSTDSITESLQAKSETNNHENNAKSIKKSLQTISKKKSLNRLLYFEQIAAKQTKASKLKSTKGEFKKIQHKDYVDYGTNKLIENKLKALDFNSGTISLNAKIIGVCINEEGSERFLIEWLPENYASNEWVDRDSFEPKKVIQLNRVKTNNEMDNLKGFYRPFRFRIEKRK